jgi:ADP-ribose pyrophosphatase YjhB (NUDIX family)
MKMSEKISIRPATIVLKDGKVLLVRSDYGGEEFFLFPGGGLEFGETLEDCAVRETLEETGLKVKVGKLIHINEYIYKNDWKKRSITPFFLAKIVNSSEIISRKDDGGKIKEVIWMGVSELDKIDLRPKIVAQALKESSGRVMSIEPYSIDFKE